MVVGLIVVVWLLGALPVGAFAGRCVLNAE
jgi:hypothetical protein